MSTPLFETRDREYEFKISTAIQEAIIKTSLDPETRIAMLLTGEVSMACMMQIACMAATSQETSSPTKTRKLCDEFSKKLHSMISAVKAEMEKGNMPFHRVIHKDRGPVAGPLS